jgi:hypothetical protein
MQTCIIFAPLGAFRPLLVGCYLAGKVPEKFPQAAPILAIIILDAAHPRDSQREAFGVEGL